MNENIILTVDYHDERCVIRELDMATEKECIRSVPTEPHVLQEMVEAARARALPRGGQVIWIQESTNGWARVQELLAARVVFVLANVLQMPLPPKARRRKTDKIDTARLQREFLNGELPRAYQPTAVWRQVRRLVALRENLVSRRTSLRNWINRYLSHETWNERRGLWSQTGMRRLRKLQLPSSDRCIVDWKLDELERLEEQLQSVQQALLKVYQNWPQAQRLDAVRGIGVLAAVSILARIGDVRRFRNAEQLIGFAGLAPGVRQSDQTLRSGHIGAGGTDVHLRHYLIEATIWARHLPRYRATYERVSRRRGNKVGRLVVARMLVRSIYKMLKDDISFDASEAGRCAMA